MKHFVKLLAMMILASTAAYSQTDTTGWGRNSRFNRMYNPSSVTEIKGEIMKIETVTPMRGMAVGVHMTIKSNGQTYSVHLGPKWFLDNQATKLNEKDNVTVEGSKVTLNGAPAIIARYVTKGTYVLELRDPNGVPVWSGGRRR